MNLSLPYVDANVWGDTFWLVHDTLSSNGVPRDHPFLFQKVLRFHVDALTHVNFRRPKSCAGGEIADGAPKNQWFLVIEGDDLQACLSMQPCENRRTGGFGTLTLQIMECYITPPFDLLFRQTYVCERKHLTTKAVLETAFFNGWHKYEMVAAPSGFLHGRRHHMMNMLYDLQESSWIGPRTIQDMDVLSFLEREYVSREWATTEELRIGSRVFPIRPGRFRPDVGRPHASARRFQGTVVTNALPP
ncbi:hypothetical protein PWT90_01322 [Aphanocladium album]|nr:hypothetical protein PWT90_01322 [Aphanocladium album]